MADDGLTESWARTRSHLARAWELLPAGDDDLGWYSEYLDHNELELAMEELERSAVLRDAPPDFWSALANAAVEMGFGEAERRYRRRLTS